MHIYIETTWHNYTILYRQSSSGMYWNLFKLSLFRLPDSLSAFWMASFEAEMAGRIPGLWKESTPQIDHQTWKGKKHPIIPYTILYIWRFEYVWMEFSSTNVGLSISMFDFWRDPEGILSLALFQTFQNPQDGYHRIIWSCTERSERGAEIQNEHPSFASCCCFPEIKPPMDLGSSDQKMIWTFHGKIIGLGEQIGLSPDSSESYGMSSLGGTAQSFCHLLPASTGWLLLVPRWIIRILPYLWIVTIPSKIKHHYTGFLMTHQLLPGIAQVGSSQLWTMCFGYVSSSAPRPLEWTIVQLGLNMLGHRTRGTTFSNSSNLVNPMPKTLQFLDRCNPFLVRRVSGNVAVPMVCTVPSRQEPKCKWNGLKSEHLVPRDYHSPFKTQQQKNTKKQFWKETTRYNST